MPAEAGHRTALLDWLACAAGGRDEQAARAARSAGDGLLDRVAAAGTAGHVLDFDDTYAPGLCHLSACVAPAAIVLATERGASIGAALDGFAAGFEAMAATARASHPALYDRGLHPTAVCGPVGAAIAAARLLDLDPAREQAAVAIALLRGAGFQAAFGSDGKALQVGLAAAAGVAAARLAAAGAAVPLERAAAGFEEALGGRYSPPGPESAVSQNWIKAYPCCLQTHAPIEAAERLEHVPAALTVVVHPLSRRAAPYDDVGDGLAAKFSIPYTVAWTLLNGPPTPATFRSVAHEVRALARRVEVRVDDRLGQSEAALEVDGRELVRVEAALGSPARPLPPDRLRTKLRELAGDRLDGALADLDGPAGDVAAAAGLP